MSRRYVIVDLDDRELVAVIGELLQAANLTAAQSIAAFAAIVAVLVRRGEVFELEDGDRVVKLTDVRAALKVVVAEEQEKVAAKVALALSAKKGEA